MLQAFEKLIRFYELCSWRFRTFQISLLSPRAYPIVLFLKSAPNLKRSITSWSRWAWPVKAPGCWVREEERRWMCRWLETEETKRKRRSQFLGWSFERESGFRLDLETDFLDSLISRMIMDEASQRAAIDDTAIFILEPRSFQSKFLSRDFFCCDWDFF